MPQLQSIPYSKALALLDAPAETRDQLLESGQVEDMSAAEIKRLTKQLKQAEKDRDEQTAAREADRRHLQDMETRIQELQARPPETITETVTVREIPEDYEALKHQVSSLQTDLAQAQQAVADAEQRAMDSMVTHTEAEEEPGSLIPTAEQMLE